ncbi:MAG: hypothetical protein WC389_18125 [Lutibacter sp.]
MKRILTGIFIGIIVGILDLIPMICQRLPWDANLSAFSMWVIIGLFTATIDLKLDSIIKGVLIAFLVLLPSAMLIVSKEPVSIIPISVMTLILGGLQGFTIDKLLKPQKRTEKK